MDPESEKAVEFIVNFPEEYYSTCLEVLSCKRSQRNDEGYNEFFEENLDEFQKVIIFNLNQKTVTDSPP